MSKWLPAESACALIDQAVRELWHARSEHAANTIDGYLDNLKEQAREFPDVPEDWHLNETTYCVGPDNRMVSIEQVSCGGPFAVRYESPGLGSVIYFKTISKHFDTVGEAIAAVAAILEAGK